MSAQNFDRGPPPDIVSSMAAARESAISSYRAAAASAASESAVSAASAVASAASVASVQSVQAEPTQEGVAAAATKGQLSLPLESATTLPVGSATPYGISSSTQTNEYGGTVLPGSSAYDSSSDYTPASQTSANSTPSTLSTTTIPSSNSTLLHPPTSVTSTPEAADPILPLPDSTQRSHSPSLSPGEKAAAIVFPILFVLGILCAFLYGRYRRRRTPLTPPSTSAAPAMKYSPFQPSPNPATAIPPPVMTSTNTNNPTYYTGLDTSSLRTHPSQRSGATASEDFPARTSLGGTFYEPPPAYNGKKTSSESNGGPPSYRLPELEFSTHGDGDPFADSGPYTTSSADAAPAAAGGREAATERDGFLWPAPTDRPGVSRTTTTRSFTSDLYSETASVHSARAARVSVSAAPQLVGARGEDEDPFGDYEAVSPVGREGVEGATDTLSPVSLVERDGRRW